MRLDEMDARSPKILCVEYDPVVLESRCAVLKYSGYDVASASPQSAEILLRSQRFNLLVVSSLSNHDLHRIIDLSDGADLVVLKAVTTASELLSFVGTMI
jgi:DNA-binding response OmpR family regulator